MVPALQFEYWQWASLTLAAPVATWGAWPFHKRRMDQPSARGDHDGHPGVARRAWPRSAGRWSRCSGATAGVPGMTHPFDLIPDRGDGPASGLGDIYLETAAGVTTFLLAGRYFEKRSKRRAGDALRALADLGAREVAVLPQGPEGPEQRIPIDRLARRRPLRRPSRREGGDRRRGGRPAAPRSTRRCSPASRSRSRSARGTRSSGRPSTVPGGSWCARRGWARTPTWRSWPAWSRRRRRARRRPSGSPTGSPGSSCPS